MTKKQLYNPVYDNMAQNVHLPPLKKAWIDPDIGQNACPWLDSYIDFSQKETPESYVTYHQMCGLAILSTVAARRIVRLEGSTQPIYPNIYSMLFGRTSDWKKSTALNIVPTIIKEAGLQYFLLPDRFTPERLLSLLGVPEKVKQIPDVKEFERKHMFAGQRIWVWHELGRRMQSMTNPSSYFAGNYEMLLHLHDSPPLYSSSTQVRGDESVKDVYLNVIGAGTPADLSTLTQKANHIWHDGFLARILWSAPPPGLRSSLHTRRANNTSSQIPLNIIDPLRTWHQRLPKPQINVMPGNWATNNGKQINGSLVSRNPVTPVVIGMTNEAEEQYANYREELHAIRYDIAEDYDDIFGGNYARLPREATKIALLFASMEGTDTVTIKHWTRAQQITEDCRAGLHAAVASALESTPNQDEKDMDKIIRCIPKIQANGLNPTVKQLMKWCSIPSETRMKNLIDFLVQAGRITEVPPGKGNYKPHYVII